VKAEFRESFAKDLKSVKDKSLLNRVTELIEAIESASLLSDDTVVFVRFLNRKDIYKYFP
jgi:hypothetical protein